MFGTMRMPTLSKKLVMLGLSGLFFAPNTMAANAPTAPIERVGRSAAQLPELAERGGGLEIGQAEELLFGQSLSSAHGRPDVDSVGAPDPCRRLDRQARQDRHH